MKKKPIRPECKLSAEWVNTPAAVEMFNCNQARELSTVMLMAHCFEAGYRAAKRGKR